MRDVTHDEVRDAVAAAGITRIDHHKCSLCGIMTFYSVNHGKLFFSSSCDCPRYWSELSELPWSDASNWINTQDNDVSKATLAIAFGIVSL